MLADDAGQKIDLSGLRCSAVQQSLASRDASSSQEAPTYVVNEGVDLEERHVRRSRAKVAPALVHLLRIRRKPVSFYFDSSVDFHVKQPVKQPTVATAPRLLLFCQRLLAYCSFLNGLIAKNRCLSRARARTHTHTHTHTFETWKESDWRYSF